MQDAHVFHFEVAGSDMDEIVTIITTVCDQYFGKMDNPSYDEESESSQAKIQKPYKYEYDATMPAMPLPQMRFGQQQNLKVAHVHAWLDQDEIELLQMGSI
jgi:hypothetical protein